jgi:molybdopterin-guanine dinucleotide biosynthesis protein A
LGGIANCTALILAGGESRRMGRDKATLPLGEKTLLQHVADTLHPLFPHLLVSVRQPRPDLAYPQICDTVANAGALAGLMAGLAAAPTPWIFAVACDMPFLHPAVVRYLAAQRGEFQAVVPVVQGHAQPLAAFYHQSCLAEFAQHPHSGMRKQLKNLAVCYVPDTLLTPLDPTLHSFFDLDTPQDMTHARGYV